MSEHDPFNLDALQREMEAAIKRDIAPDDVFADRPGELLSGMEGLAALFEDVGNYDPTNVEGVAYLKRLRLVVIDIRDQVVQLVSEVSSRRDLTPHESRASRKVRQEANKFAARLARFQQGVDAFENLTPSSRAN